MDGLLQQLSEKTNLRDRFFNILTRLGERELLLDSAPLSPNDIANKVELQQAHAALESECTHLRSNIERIMQGHATTSASTPSALHTSAAGSLGSSDCMGRSSSSSAPLRPPTAGPPHTSGEVRARAISQRCGAQHTSTSDSTSRNNMPQTPASDTLALTVKQPFASAILYKIVTEMVRTWKYILPPEGRWIALHSAKEGASDQSEEARDLRTRWLRCPRTRDLPCGLCLGFVHLKRIEEGEPGTFRWVIDNTCALNPPVALGGKQGLWFLPLHVRRPAFVISNTEAVLEQFEFAWGDALWPPERQTMPEVGVGKRLYCMLTHPVPPESTSRPLHAEVVQVMATAHQCCINDGESLLLANVGLEQIPSHWDPNLVGDFNGYGRSVRYIPSRLHGIGDERSERPPRLHVSLDADTYQLDWHYFMAYEKQTGLSFCPGPKLAKAVGSTRALLWGKQPPAATQPASSPRTNRTGPIANPRTGVHAPP